MNGGELNNAPHGLIAAPGVLLFHEVVPRFPLARVRAVAFYSQRLRALTLQSLQMEHNEVLLRPAPFEDLKPESYTKNIELCRLSGEHLQFPMVSARSSVRMLVLNRHVEPVALVVRVEFAPA